MPDQNENIQTPPELPPEPAVPAAPENQPQAPETEQVGLRVSLIPAEELNRKDPRAGFKNFIIISAVATLIMGGTVAFLAVSFFMGKDQVAKIDTQTATYVAQADSIASSLKDSRLMQQRLRALSELLAVHQYGGQVFGFLEKYTLSDVVLSGLSMTDTGVASMNAYTTSFESYAAQIAELRTRPEIKSFTASGMSPEYGENGLNKVSFSLSIEFKPEFFASQSVAGK